MGFHLNDIQEYSVLKYHEMRIHEIESFWKRFGFWLFDQKQEQES
jgi:hypothetical protein